jgi:hypothetical protein
MFRQQLVADIVEIADQRHVDAEPVQPFADARHRRGAFGPVDRDANQFRAGPMKGRDLGDGGIDIGGIRIGHRLDDNRMAATDHDIADRNGYRTASRQGRG